MGHAEDGRVDRGDGGKDGGLLVPHPLQRLRRKRERPLEQERGAQADRQEQLVQAVREGERQDVEDPASGVALKHPGGFAVVNGQRLQIRRPAPHVGQHNQEVYAEELGLSEAAMEELQVAGVI